MTRAAIKERFQQSGREMFFSKICKFSNNLFVSRSVGLPSCLFDIEDVHTSGPIQGYITLPDKLYPFPWLNPHHLTFKSFLLLSLCTYTYMMYRSVCICADVHLHVHLHAHLHVHLHVHVQQPMLEISFKAG